jgi:uncharacterized repeat protein (TIGR01451 family)
MAKYKFGSPGSGLEFEIDAIPDGLGGTTFTVHVITGSLNLNALYWGDGDSTAGESFKKGFTGANSENSLNMNGANVVWDDNGNSTGKQITYDGGVKLSDAGLGHGTATFLEAGETYSFTVANLDLSEFATLGVRATSTSTQGGSIKWVDEHPGEPPTEPNAALTIDKNAAESTVDHAGQVIHYTIDVDNAGNVDLTNVVLTDPFADVGSIQLVGGDDGDNVLETTETWHYTATHTVTQAEMNAGATLVNVATADTNQTNPQSDSATSTVTQNPSLAIDKTFVEVTGGNDNGVADMAGDVLNYTVTVTNTGNVTLTGVTIVDPLTGQNIFGVTLAPGASQTFNTAYILTQADLDGQGGGDGDIDNTATADSNQTGPVSDSATVALPTPQPGLAIDKVFISVTGGNNNGVADAPGDVLNYTVTVSNVGNVTLTGVTVVDPLTGQNISGVTLAPGASQIFNTSYTLTQADLDGAGNAGSDHDIDNTATADSNQTGPVSDSATVALPTPQPNDPAMAIDKVFVNVTGGNNNGVADAPGDVLNYTVTVSNVGNVNLTDVSVVDPLTGQNISGVTLAPGASQIFVTSYTLTQADLNGAGNAGSDHDIDNTAIADSNETSPIFDSERVPLIYNPSLSIDKVFVDVTGGNNNGIADAVGDVLHYTVTVSNTGNVDLTGVTVVDPLTGQNISGVFLAPGASAGFNSSYTLTQADLNGMGNAGSDHDIDNIAIADSNETSPVSDSATVPIVTPPPTHPALNLEKDVASITGGTNDGKVDSAGDVIHYALAVQNTGDVTLTGIQVFDPFADPGSIHLVPDAATADGELDLGETWHYTAQHTVTQAEITSNGGGDGMLENTAIAFSDQTAGNPDSASASVEICIPTDLLLSQGSFEGTSIPPGLTWVTAPIAGWLNLGSPTNAIETWSAEVVAAQTNGHLATFGNFAVEMDSTGSLNVDPGPGGTDPVGLAVFDRFVTHVDACEGESYQLSLFYTSRNIPDWVTATDTDSFDVLWNGVVVGHFDPADSSQWHFTGAMQVTGAAGVDTLEIREAGANDSLGAVIDNVQLVGCACQDSDLILA